MSGYYRKEAFKFGVCTNSALAGATVVDMVTIPGPTVDVAVEDQLIGGSKRSLDGTLRVDRFALKRKITIVPWGFASNTEYWSVLRFWKSFQGPWIFFDQTVANLLTSDQKLLLTWTTAAGALVAPRADGAINVAVGATVQMGPTTAPTGAQMIPVIVGTAYTAGVGLCGAGGITASTAWQATLTVTWFTAAGTFISSVASVCVSTAAPQSFSYVGGLVAGRFASAVTAPATAAYAQLSVSNSGSSPVDVLDPALITGPNDVGNAWMLVNIDALPEAHHHPQVASLTLQLSEI